jgi:hypothetical protein
VIFGFVTSPENHALFTLRVCSELLVRPRFATLRLPVHPFLRCASDERWGSMSRILEKEPVEEAG